MQRETSKWRQPYQEWVAELLRNPQIGSDASLTPAEVEEAMHYFNWHQRRFEYLVELVGEIASEVSGTDRALTVLDIGPTYFTGVLKEVFEFDVTTLDFYPLVAQLCAERGIKFIEHDLCTPGIPLEHGSFDLILFNEVIEHIPQHPGRILDELWDLLKLNGTLILQTPNFTNLENRVRMLIGQNVQDEFPPPGEDLLPGHFREYCMNELESLATQSGFQIVEAEYCTYWDRTTDASAKQRIRRYVLQLFPSLRSGITIVARKGPPSETVPA